MRSPREADSTDDGLAEIVKLLSKEVKRDFRHYKRASLSRRTRRRMCLHHIEHETDYLDFLQKHPDEVGRLAKDLLISVTDFFRDPADGALVLRQCLAFA